MVAHLWANQSQSDARNGTGSVYFDGPTIYSYGNHFPIATIFPKKSVVIFNGSRYSPTTRQHQSDARQAIDREVYKSFSVNPEHSDYSGYRRSYDDLNNHQKNYEYFINSFKSSIESAKTARAYSSCYNGFLNSEDSAKQKLNYSILETAKDYCKIFDIKFDYAIPENEIETILKAKREKDRKRKPLSKFKKDRSRRLAKRRQILKYINLKTDKIPYISNLYGSNYQKLCSGMNRLRLQNLLPVIRKDVKKFLTGENPDTQYSYEMKQLAKNKIPVLLRIKQDEIQTSMGAEMPVKFAKHIWLAVAKCKASKTPFEPNGKTLYAGSFQVDRIEANGDMKVGCHFVKYGFIKSIARQLNLI